MDCALPDRLEPPAARRRLGSAIRRTKFSLLLASATLQCASSAHSAIAIVGGTLIDVSKQGRGTADISDSVILIDRDQILTVGNEQHVRIPEGFKILDAHGRYILPGLIDGYGAVRSRGFADAYLYEGVTSVLVPIAAIGSAVDGESRAVSTSDGPSILTAVPIAGYATPQPASRNLSDANAPLALRRLSAAEIKSAVDAAANSGRKGVIVGFEAWPVQTDAIVSEARHHGLFVMGELARTPYPAAARARMDAFVRNDKYLVVLGDETERAAYALDPTGPGGRAASRAVCAKENDSRIDRFGRQLSNSHTALMPVLVLEATADAVGGPNLWQLAAAPFVRAAELDDPVDKVTGARPYLQAHPDRRDAIRGCAIRKEEADARLHRAGTIYLAGSAAASYGVMPGSGLHVELQLLQKIGLSPREAFASATSNFADVFRWKDRGRIEVGRRADILIVKADPRQDVSAVDTIDTVIVAGQVVDRGELIARAVASDDSGKSQGAAAPTLPNSLPSSE